MDVRRAAAAALVALLVVASVTASAGAAATTDDPLDDGADGNTTDTVEGTTGDTTNTTDTVENTTDDATDQTTDTVDQTTDATENTTETTSDSAEQTDGGDSSAATEDTVETVEETVDATEATGDDTTAETDDAVNATAAATERTVESVTDATTETLDATTDELGQTTDALTGTASTTGTTVPGVLASDRAGADGGVGEASYAGSVSESEPRPSERASTGETRGTAAAETAGSERASDDTTDASPGPSAPRPPLPEHAAATTAVVAGVVGLARPPAVTSTGAKQTAAAASQRLAAGFDRLKRFLGLLGYSRYDDTDPLDHETRAALYDAIRADPGVYLSALGERADVNLSTARHHVRVLVDENLVATAKRRGRRRYYPAAADDRELAAALSDPATAAVLEALADAGEAHVGLLADELDRDPSTVSHHLQRLADDDLVEREREGRAVMNRLTDPAADALAGADDHAVADD